MKGLLWILSALLLAETVAIVTCLTNQEFIDLIEPYAEVTEAYGDDDTVEDSTDVITLPGNPEDEVDFDYLLARLGIHLDETKGIGEKTTQLWWHHHRHHHHHHHHKTFHCSCHHYSCGCCLHHTFKFFFKHFKLHACLTVAYLRSNIGFEVTFTLNGHRLFHKEISLKHPPALCFGVPGLRTFARVCLEIYDVNLRTKHLCARLAGVLDLKFHKFRVHLKLGCFRIPILDKDAFLLMVNDKDFLKIKPLDDQPSRDLTNTFRGLQLEQESRSNDADDESFDSDEYVDQY